MTVYGEGERGKGKMYVKLTALQCAMCWTFSSIYWSRHTSIHLSFLSHESSYHYLLKLTAKWYTVITFPPWNSHSSASASRLVHIWAQGTVYFHSLYCISKHKLVISVQVWLIVPRVDFQIEALGSWHCSAERLWWDTVICAGGAAVTTTLPPQPPHLDMRRFYPPSSKDPESHG